MSLDNLAPRLDSDKAHRKILVVDDNEMLLKFWDRLLTRGSSDAESYRITKNPQRALQWLEHTKFDVAIIDVVMPLVDGFDFVRMAAKVNPLMRLVFTTAYECDFKNVHLGIKQEIIKDIHVLLKPYLDISKVENFLERLYQNDPTLQQDKPILNDENLRFHLWNL